MKAYLGNNVYVETDRGSLRLTQEEHLTRDVVTLSPDAFQELVFFANMLEQRNIPQSQPV